MNCKCILENKKKFSAKQFTVFVNGNNQQYKRVVINPRKIRKWHHVLTEITEKLDPYFGPVKKLYTSESGVTINSFTDLENNTNYVASTNRKLQVVNGGYKLDTGPRRDIFEHYLTCQLKSKNRQKKLAYVRRDLLVIYVFYNGKENEPPCKFVFTQEDLNNWDRSLNYIALLLDTPDRDIKYLYNSKGHRVCGPWELQHGASYVAVGFHEKFIKRNYKINEDITEIWKNGIPVTNKNLGGYHCQDVVKSWKQNLGWKTFANESSSNKTSTDQINDSDQRCYYYDVDFSTNSMTSLSCNCSANNTTSTNTPSNCQIIPTIFDKQADEIKLRKFPYGKKINKSQTEKEIYQRLKDSGREVWPCKFSYL